MKIKNYIFCLSAVLCMSFTTIHAATNISEQNAKNFINLLRARHPVNTWGSLEGNIIQKKRDSSGELNTNRGKIKVSMLFTKAQAIAMIKLSDKDLSSSDTEVYKVGQGYNGSEPTVLSSNIKENSSMSKFGVKPSDFTMAFLYWDLDSKLSQEKTTYVKGLKCRIINLVNPKTKERAEIFASTEYLYPLQVKWYKKDSKSSYRTMVIDSFYNTGKLGAPSEITLSGPGWKTRISFNDEQIQLGFISDQKGMANLFK